MSQFLNTTCAALYLALAAYALFGARPGRSDVILAATCIVTAAWAAAAGFYGATTPNPVVGTLELARSIGWYALVLHLYHRAVEGGSRQARIFSLIGAATVLVVAMSLASARGLTDPATDTASFGSMELDARLGLAVCTILLIENLYRNASGDLRWHVALPCIALGGLCVYDILFYGDGVLFRRLSPTLAEGRPVVTALVAPLLAISVGRNRRRWGASFQLSRTVVFHTASLVVIGVFLLALAGVGEALRLIGSERQGDWGIVLEIGLVCGGILAAGVFLTSGSARSNLRSLVVDNFFAQRYDYRVEWLRCIRTLSQPGAALALHTRAIRAVAQVVDSPGGLLFLRESDDGLFRWAGSWNLPASTAQIASDHPLLPLFRGGTWVVEAPSEPETPAAAAGAPWIAEQPELWLAVPLSHAGRLTGFTLVARPRAPFALDREVFDLLRIVGQAVASHVAEQQAAETLLQTRHLRAYGERFAFVAHDIKNVASQLSLLLANAEHHLSNPEFQKDMLLTVGGSVQKITTLLARLKAPQEEPAAAVLAPAARIQALVAARDPAQRSRIYVEYGATGHMDDQAPEARSDTMVLGASSDATVHMAASGFDAVLAHLLDNAFEASAPDAAVRIKLRQEGERVTIDIIDRGTGMSPEFIRDRLFHPFSSSKTEGFGLGVYQARELLRQAGGDLLVTSALGSGTIMRLSLPAAEHPAVPPPAPERAR